jgi:hypothetical protein
LRDAFRRAFSLAIFDVDARLTPVGVLRSKASSSKEKAPGRSIESASLVNSIN